MLRFARILHNIFTKKCTSQHEKRSSCTPIWTQERKRKTDLWLWHLSQAIWPAQQFKGTLGTLFYLEHVSSLFWTISQRLFRFIDACTLASDPSNAQSARNLSLNLHTCKNTNLSTLVKNHGNATFAKNDSLQVQISRLIWIFTGKHAEFYIYFIRNENQFHWIKKYFGTKIFLFDQKLIWFSWKWISCPPRFSPTQK